MPITNTSVLKIKVNGQWVQIPTIEGTGGGADASGAIRFAGVFNSLQDYTDLVTEISGMTVDEKKELVGSYWLIPGGVIQGFDQDTLVWYKYQKTDSDYASANDVANLGIDAMNLKWHSDIDSGTSFPVISQYARVVYNGRLFLRTDENKLYVYHHYNNQDHWVFVANANATTGSITSGNTGFVTGDDVYQALYAVENASY